MTKIKINHNLKNALFNRHELKGFIEADVVPKKTEVVSMIAKEMNVAEDVVSLLRIKGKFGTNHFDFEAEVYDSAKDLNHLKIKKKKPKEAKK